MSAKVFISCGQRSAEERQAAADTAELLSREGFSVYVAIAAQSIEDVNSGIISQLRRSDYYVFIDFARDAVGSNFRGSLFTNQELAIAYVLEFERVIFLQQQDVALEGLLRYMGSNATRFDAPASVPSLVLAGFRERNWSPAYSRHLVPCRRRWSETYLQYADLAGRFLYIDVENRRHDLAAYDAVARLVSIDGASSPDRSHLKVTGHPGYAQIIWPQNHGAFDMLMQSCNEPGHVFLNSALDAYPKSPVIDRPGTYHLRYAVLARQFPILYFTVRLTVDNDPLRSEAEIEDIDSGA